MTSKQYSFNLGNVDYDKLQTEADFRKEAKRLLPDAMKQIGKKVAEGLWKETQKALGMNNSGKAEFVREATGNFAKDTKQKKQVEQHIYDRLKEGKGSQ